MKLVTKFLSAALMLGIVCSSAVSTCVFAGGDEGSGIFTFGNNALESGAPRRTDVNPIDIVKFDEFSRGVVVCWCAPGRTGFDPKTGMGTIRYPRGTKEILKNPIYSAMVNNTDSAASLPDFQIARGSLFNDESYGFMSMSIFFDDAYITDMSDVQNRRAFLRVNTKTGVVYTVRRTEVTTPSRPMNYYMFRAFRPQGGRLYLLSNWCVSQIPDLSSFDRIIPHIWTFRDVQQIDPGAILFNKSNVPGLVSHHAFCDKNGTKIYIDYVRRPDGEYYVSDVQRYEDGHSLLPYLLPIDRQLIDPSYVPTDDEKPSCTIM